MNEDEERGQPEEVLRERNRLGVLEFLALVDRDSSLIVSMSRVKEENERLSFGTLISLFSPNERILFATNCQIQLRTSDRSIQQTHDSTTQPSSDCIDVPVDGVTNCRC